MATGSPATQRFTLKDFAWRLLFGIVLVLATWNPAGVSYVSWVLNHAPEMRWYVVLVGAALAILYIIYVRMTLRSIGRIGIGVVLALCAGATWWLLDAGFITLEGGTSLWLALVALGLVLGIGMSWAHIWASVVGPRQHMEEAHG